MTIGTPGGGGGPLGGGFEPSTATGSTLVFGLQVKSRRGRSRRHQVVLWGQGGGSPPAWFLFRGIGVKFDSVAFFPVVQVDRSEIFVWKKQTTA